MDDMLKDFVVEAMDLAVNVEEHLLRLERDPNNKETLNAVFRSFHTIKGGAGFMNLPALVAACHLTENLFDALRNGAAPVTPLAIEAALQASGFVADQLTDLSNGAAPEQLASMPDSLERILRNADRLSVNIELPTQASVERLAPEKSVHTIKLAMGAICIKLPMPPGTLPTLWGDDDRYVSSYLSAYPGYYLTGDGGYLDEDGYLYVMGRTDDVLNVAGHRIGTMEVESALVDHPDVAEAAVVGKTHEIKGQAVAAFVTLKEGFKPSDQLADAVPASSPDHGR